MKRYRLILLLFLIPFLACAQPFPKVIYNYKNCSLTITAEKWIKDGDKSIFPVTVKLSNNSNDTLKFESELCFNGMFYCKVIDKNFRITNEPDKCDKNYTIVEKVAPNNYRTERLLLIRSKYGNLNAKKLQLAFGLTLTNSDNPMLETIKGITGDNAHKKAYYDDLKRRTHIIISNTIKV